MKFQIKKFLSIYIVTVLLLCIMLPIIHVNISIAETISGKASPLDEKRPHGFKIDDAEFWDYNANYDKHNIWIDQGNGGSGGGGGAGDGGTRVAGNNGFSNENGGIMGNAAGVGLGGSNTQGLSGSGSGTAGGNAGGGANSGTTGSAIADALRALKQEIEESRAESVAAAIENALNESAILESIKAEQAKQESIQRQLAQESIMAKFNKQQETAREFYQSPKVAEAEYQKSFVDKINNVSYDAPLETINNNIYFDINSTAPTSAQITPNFYDSPNTQNTMVRPILVPDAVKIVTGNVSKNTSETVEAPTSLESEIPNEVAPPEIQISQFEPGDFIDNSNVNNVVVTAQTIPREVTQPTESMTVPLTETAIENPTEVTNPVETISEETTVDEEGQGSKGGNDNDVDEDKTGEAAKDENMGDAEDSGSSHQSDSGDDKGKKIFELDHNGNIGINPQKASLFNEKGFMKLMSWLLFVSGSIAYLIRSMDKKNKKGYF